MKYLLSTTLFLTFLLTSCDQIKSTFEEAPVDKNLVQTFHKNGKIKSEIRLDENKKRHGIVKQYYESGTIKNEIEYAHGTKLNAVQYYKTGGKQMEFLYKNGLKHGERKKYWQNGKLQSVLEYAENNPKTGLIEYNKKGEKITSYPKLVINQIDNLETSGEYIVQVYFSSNRQRGNYYQGKLDNGALDTQFLSKLKESSHKGIITFRPVPGTFIMKKIDVVGQYKTPQGNPYIVQKSINVAIDF
ncbi:toxin-antitoxin system YwqK family antitoxin [Reichenbachiella sp.]|uniref:toxin-antitoxin system YwqK family antitoxin n=1 Tax=Reichenbachiella sp. TaxID=2184521 RepID=UPI003BB17E75